MSGVTGGTSGPGALHRNGRASDAAGYRELGVNLDSDQDGIIQGLLERARQGDVSARNSLIERIYGELHSLAEGQMRHEAADPLLQATSLVHEALEQLLQNDRLLQVVNRGHLLAAASRAMRHVLVDHARRRQAAKRGGHWQRQPFDALLDHQSPTRSRETLVLHEALLDLEELNARHSQVVELRYFGGFTVPDIARHLNVSVSTVESDLRLAQAWLRVRLREDDHHHTNADDPTRDHPNAGGTS